MSKYRKALVAVAAAALTAAQSAVHMSDSAHAWVTVALAALGAAGVFLTPNAAPADPAEGPGPRPLSGRPAGY